MPRCHMASLLQPVIPASVSLCMRLTPGSWNWIEHGQDFTAKKVWLINLAPWRHCALAPDAPLVEVSSQGCSVSGVPILTAHDGDDADDAFASIMSLCSGDKCSGAAQTRSWRVSAGEADGPAGLTCLLASASILSGCILEPVASSSDPGIVMMRNQISGLESAIKPEFGLTTAISDTASMQQVHRNDMGSR